MKMPRCQFQDNWLSHKDFKTWIERDHVNVNSAKCKLCKSTIDVSTMGTSALRSHAKGVKHQAKVRNSDSCTSMTLDGFFQASGNSVSHASNSVEEPVAGCSTISTYASKSECLNAEVWQCLKTVASGSSFRSNTDTSHVWQQQFPDSAIARRATCGQTKSMYLTCYGLAPFYKQLTAKKVRGTEYVLLFDESLNKKLQKKQLDFLVRFWDGGRVSTRYLDSCFLGHATANDMMKAFESKIPTYGLKNLVQLSMDGQNVN